MFQTKRCIWWQWYKQYQQPTGKNALQSQLIIVVRATRQIGRTYFNKMGIKTEPQKQQQQQQSNTKNAKIAKMFRLLYCGNREVEKKRQHTRTHTQNTNDQKTAIIHTTKVIMIIMPMSIYFFSLLIRSFHTFAIFICYLQSRELTRSARTSPTWWWCWWGKEVLEVKKQQHTHMHT